MFRRRVTVVSIPDSVCVVLAIWRYGVVQLGGSHTEKWKWRLGPEEWFDACHDVGGQR